MSKLTDFLPAAMPKATEQQAREGTRDDVVMTPMTTIAAISALAGDVVKEVFTTSGVFHKDDDDICYLVDCIGGGAGGPNLPGIGTIPGGWAGQRILSVVMPSDIGDTVTVTVGAGGLGHPAGTTGFGSPGGDTSFGGKVNASGGPAEETRDPAIPDAAGEGWVPRFYNPGAILGLNKDFPTAGGGARYASSPFTVRVGYDAALTENAGRGGKGNAENNQKAGNGDAPGGGGGASVSNGGGGNGARGEVRVYRFKRTKQ